MGTLHILFYSRPEIIGKFSSFNNDMYLRIKTAHSICRTHNIVLCYRSIEHAGIPKLQLHSFGDIEHSAFLFIRYILPIDESVRIMTEFLFQRFVDSGYHKGLLTILLLMKSLFIFFRYIGIGQNIIKDAFRIRIRRSKRLSVGNRQFFLGCRLYLLQFFFRKAFVAQQHPAEFHQRIGFFYISKFIFIPIKRLLIRIGMRTDTDTIGMYNDWSTIRYGKFTGLAHSIHGVEHIFSIAMNNLQILETGKIIGILTDSRLILFGDRDTISIILPYKYHRKAFPAGSVNRLINISLRRSGFSMRGDRHPFMPVINHGTRHSGSMKVVCSGG